MARKLAIALAALVLTDLGVGLVYHAITGDGVYYQIFHPDRGRNRRYRTRSEIYHHDLRKEVALPAVWGDEYFVFTNSLGFRDREVRTVELDVEGPRILLIGDSFAEGVRVEFDESLAGLLAAHYRPSGIDVLNAGVSSYSPTIYERKIRYLIEDVGLHFTHVIVLLDVSDIPDDAERYVHDDAGNVVGPDDSSWGDAIRRFLREYSVLYGVPQLLRQERPRPPETALQDSLNNPRGLWTIDEDLYRDFGEPGLRRSAQNMDRLLDLLRAHDIGLTVVVYPWPAQILHGDLDSAYVRFWRSWSEKREIAFIDLFPSFVPTDPDRSEEMIREHFIGHDFHWNEAGHRRAAAGVIEALQLAAPSARPAPSFDPLRRDLRRGTAPRPPENRYDLQPLRSQPPARPRC